MTDLRTHFWDSLPAFIKLCQSAKRLSSSSVVVLRLPFKERAYVLDVPYKPDTISAQDSVISINRAFSLLHTKLARINASSIPHMHAFTCRYRHLSLSASPLRLLYKGPMCPPPRSTPRGDTEWRLLPAGRPHHSQSVGLK